MDELHVLFKVLPGPYGSVGIITLNRPEQLNALTETMCVAIHAQLLEWEESAAIKAVVIQGIGERAFCAGGDLRQIYHWRDQPDKASHFFANEYRLNRVIYHFSKPYIAFMQGITMGGGLGLSVNGKYRLATETLKLAMPETGIGFFTDVGASYFLSRCPGKIGFYLGLTGTIISAADAQQIGLVDKIFYNADMPAVLEALVQAKWSDDLYATVTQIISSFPSPAVSASLLSRRNTIDRCFAQLTIEEILNALEKVADEWSKQTAQLLRTRSPTSLKVVLKELQYGKLLDFTACMKMEYHIANRFLANPDFYEGIRAVLIDKDHSPCWHPAILEEITDVQVAAYFPPI